MVDRKDDNARKAVYRYSSLPDGWKVVKAPNRQHPAPSGWVWAHNDRDMFARGFRMGLVKQASVPRQ